MCEAEAILFLWVASYHGFCMCVVLAMCLFVCVWTLQYVQSIRCKDAILCVLAAQYVWICLQFVCNIRQGGAICARSASPECKREWAWWDNGESRCPPTKVVPPSSSSSVFASAKLSSWSYPPSSSLIGKEVLANQGIPTIVIIICMISIIAIIISVAITSIIIIVVVIVITIMGKVCACRPRWSSRSPSTKSYLPRTSQKTEAQLLWGDGLSQNAIGDPLSNLSKII